MRTSIVLSMLTVFAGSALSQEASMANLYESGRSLAPTSETEIRHVIERSYVRGIFVLRDSNAVKGGFHKEFILSVLHDDGIIVVPLRMWLDRLKLSGTPSEDTVRHVFETIDVTNNTAVAKLRIYINDKQEYTDYMGLYKFSDGWKIVNKVFQSHD